MDPLRPPHAAMVEHVISKIDLGDFAFPIRLQLSHNGYNVYFHMTVTRREVKTKVETSRVHTVPLPIQKDGRPEDVLLWIVDCVMGMVKDELGRHMTYDGHRIFDPNRKSRLDPPIWAMDKEGNMTRIDELVATKLRPGQDDDL